MTELTVQELYTHTQTYVDAETPVYVRIIGPVGAEIQVLRAALGGAINHQGEEVLAIDVVATLESSNPPAAHPRIAELEAEIETLKRARDNELAAVYKDGYSAGQKEAQSPWSDAAPSTNPAPTGGKRNEHYYKRVEGYTYLDFYRLVLLYDIADPAAQHALKKLLAMGKRAGGKDLRHDWEDIRDTANRRLEMLDEDGA